jgi:hypothetical protein
MNESLLSRRTFIRNTSVMAAAANASGMRGKDRAPAEIRYAALAINLL